jgi:uncharacterized protein
MKRFSLLLAIAALAMIASAPVHAQQTPTPVMERVITVNGDGVVRVVPDRAIVSFAVVTRHQNPQEARRLNAQAAERAMNAVRQLGIPERQIQLLNLRLDEEIDWRDGSASSPGATCALPSTIWTASLRS